MSDKEQFTQYLNDKVNKQVQNVSDGMFDFVQKAVDEYNEGASKPFDKEQIEFLKTLSLAITKHSVAASAAVTAEMFNDDTKR